MSKTTIKSYLARHEFFSRFEEAHIDFLAGTAGEHKIKRGEVLFHQGERADKFYVVESGRISVQIPALMGPPLEIQSLGEHEILGWSWLISPYKWDFNARAEEDTVLLEFDGAAVLARCEEDPSFGYQILKRFTVLMSERLESGRERMMEQWIPAGFA